MLFACDLPEGSEIIVPNYSTWFPVVPMRLFGLVPVFVDVDPRTMNLSVEAFKKAITPKTRGVLAVHWYGMPCDMEDICAVAKEHDIIVLEDASHAHGAKVKDTFIGNWGRMAGFSLQSTKPLPAIEGGMGVYKDRGDYERAVTYGNYDLPGSFPEDSPYRKYQGTAFGSKLRIHPVAAILARIQLGDLEKRNAEGVAQIKALNDRITQLPGLTAQYAAPGVSRVFYSRNFLFVDEKKAGMSRAAVAAALKAEGMDVAEYNWTLLHTYPIFSESKWWRHMPVLPKEIPGCDEVNRSTLSLPYFTSAQPELVEQYAAAFEKVWAHKDTLGKG
jgi:perosamine synthetase